MSVLCRVSAAERYASVGALTRTFGAFAAITTVALERCRLVTPVKVRTSRMNVAVVRIREALIDRSPVPPEQ